jgi:hypothetical protein
MTKLIPDSKPKLKKTEAAKIIEKYLTGSKPPNILIGIRGYYSKTMGATEGNDINLYDDAIILYGDKYGTFNANTDPSFVKQNGRNLAKLDTGLYTFYKGRHKGQYNALRAYPEGVILPCTRDGKPDTCSAINIHKGGINTSSKDRVWSAGCQTLPATQWNSFIETVYELMLKHQQKTIPYILIDAEEMSLILNS